MSTSEELWDQIESAHEARVVELVSDIERRVETRVMLVIAEQLQSAQYADLLRVERDLHLALLRTQRTRRRWERSTRYMRVLQRSNALANARPLRKLDAHPGLEELAVQEAARRAEAARGTR